MKGGKPSKDMPGSLTFKEINSGAFELDSVLSRRFCGDGLPKYSPAINW